MEVQPSCTALETLLQVGDAFFELGNSLVFGQAFLPPAVPDPPLELYRALQDLPVLGLDPGTFALYAPLHVPHTPPV